MPHRPDPLHGLAVRRLKEAFLFLYGDYDNDGDEAYTYVHFDVTAEEIDHSTVFYPVNTCYGELPTPTHPGRYFRGWYTESGARLTGDDIAQIPITVSADWGSSPVSDTGVQSTDWDNPYSDLKEGSGTTPISRTSPSPKRWMATPTVPSSRGRLSPPARR